MTPTVLPIPEVAPAPLSLRTDAMGIFTVLFAAGLANLNEPPDSLSRQVDDRAAFTWVFSLIVFGLVGLVGMLLPRRLQIIGLGLEALARTVLGLAAMVYCGAILQGFPLEVIKFSAMIYFGISALMFVGAFQIFRWLRAQRRVINEVMEHSHQ